MSWVGVGPGEVRRGEGLIINVRIPARGAKGNKRSVLHFSRRRGILPSLLAIQNQRSILVGVTVQNQ